QMQIRNTQGPLGLDSEGAVRSIRNSSSALFFASITSRKAQENRFFGHGQEMQDGAQISCHPLWTSSGLSGHPRAQVDFPWLAPETENNSPGEHSLTNSSLNFKW